MAGEDVWRLIKAEYATGKQPKELSGRFGVAAKTISNRASAEGWKVDREEVGRILADETPRAIASRLVATAADYVQQHTNDWQTIRSAIIDVIEAEPDPLEKAKMASAVYKALEAVQKGQRLSLGLDKPEPPKVENTAQAVMVVPPDSEEWQNLVATGDMEAEPRPADSVSSLPG